MGESNSHDQTTADWFRVRNLAHQAAQRTAVPTEDGIFHYSDGLPVEDPVSTKRGQARRVGYPEHSQDSLRVSIRYM